MIVPCSWNAYAWIFRWCIRIAAEKQWNAICLAYGNSIINLSKNCYCYCFLPRITSSFRPHSTRKRSMCNDSSTEIFRARHCWLINIRPSHVVQVEMNLGTTEVICPLQFVTELTSNVMTMSLTTTEVPKSLYQAIQNAFLQIIKSSPIIRHPVIYKSHWYA